MSAYEQKRDDAYLMDKLYCPFSDFITDDTTPI